jgi:trans-4-hydroxy-L-proline dehydratase
MRERIKKLREETLAHEPRISAERAVLLTEFLESDGSLNLSTPVLRASAFHHIMENKRIWIGDGELIVGERGPEPAAVPTYPEVCLHSLQDLDILDTREKIPYRVSESVKQVYREKIIPFWKGNSQRERIFKALPPEWIDAYEAGIYTEFQEQRGPGHTALGDKIFRQGMLDIQEDIQDSIAKLDFENDPEALDKRDELEGMSIAAEGILRFAERHADELDRLAAAEGDATRKQELEQMAVVCRRVPAHAPRNFWEALQCYWFVHVGVITEINPWDSFNPGRLDQHLHPFYEQDMAAGILTEEDTRELLQAFWVKFHNHPAPSKVGVTAEESGTYTDFSLINVGGVKADGSDGVNEVSYMILDVVREMRMVQPSSMVQLSKKNPERFIKHTIRVVREGFGQPSIFNTDAIVQELTRQGKSLEDARCAGASGCVEAGAFGKEAYILTGYFNLPKILEITLHNGTDPRTGKGIGLETGEPDSFRSYDEFFKAYAEQVRHFASIKIRGNNIIDRLFARRIPVPFLSLVIDDCVANGKDYHAGGARYNTSYIQGVGLGSITDCLTSICYNVFEDGVVSLPELVQVLECNFEGHEDLRHRFVEATPKYGNDDDRADDIMREVFEAYYGAINGRPNVRGGSHRVNMLPTTVHVYFGDVTGALPDGRRAHAALSEGISPVQGADRLGPTAVIKSAAKLDHVRTGGTLLNQKFTPQLLSDEAGVTKVSQLVRSYFRLDGHHIQFNVVDAETLRQAQANPEQHRDLIVRVAGYSDYFINLCPELQNEIIHRTEHQEF